jgi:hypothetical protein
MGTLKNTAARRWLAVGTGVGVEIGEDRLNVAIVRARPAGPAVVAVKTIERFRERPAAEWGAEYAAFLREHKAAHLPAFAILPRREVILRVLNLAGVPPREFAAAIALQIDSLHPYGEDEAVHEWLRLEGGSALVAIVRRAVLEEYTRLFTEAGVRLAALTLSASVLRSGLRLYGAPPSSGFITLVDSEQGIEAYGESDARPVFSAAFDVPPGRALPLAVAELRLPAETQPAPLSALLPRPRTAPADFDLERWAFPYSAALAGACALFARPLNLLPAPQRAATSRLRYAPTAALVVLLAACVAALAAVKPVENRRYMEALSRELAAVEPEARKAASLDGAISGTRARSRLIDSYRRRSQADLDTLLELTRILQPPAYLEQIELNRNRAILGGVSDQAAALLKLIDESPRFSGSEFTIPLARVPAGEKFRLQAAREAAE